MTTIRKILLAATVALAMIGSAHAASSASEMRAGNEINIAAILTTYVELCRTSTAEREYIEPVVKYAIATYGQQRVLEQYMRVHSTAKNLVGMFCEDTSPLISIAVARAR